MNRPRASRALTRTPSSTPDEKEIPGRARRASTVNAGTGRGFEREVPALVAEHRDRLPLGGIPVGVGGDLVATAPDLDVFNEVAALRQDHPGLAPAAALRIATLNGAKALGLASDLGTIEAGKRAALAVVGLNDPADDPLEAVTWSSETIAALEDAPWDPSAR